MFTIKERKQAQLRKINRAVSAMSELERDAKPLRLQLALIDQHYAALRIEMHAANAELQHLAVLANEFLKEQP